jgi:hypothetical protein
MAMKKIFPRFAIDKLVYGDMGYEYPQYIKMFIYVYLNNIVSLINTAGGKK